MVAISRETLGLLEYERRGNLTQIKENALEALRYRRSDIENWMHGKIRPARNHDNRKRPDTVNSDVTAFTQRLERWPCTSVH